MTRKQLNAIAEAVRTAPYYDVDKEREAVAKHFADMCAREYSGSYGFNRARFLAACGVE